MSENLIGLFFYSFYSRRCSSYSWPASFYAWPCSLYSFVNYSQTLRLTSSSIFDPFWRYKLTQHWPLISCIFSVTSDVTSLEDVTSRCKECKILKVRWPFELWTPDTLSNLTLINPVDFELNTFLETEDTASYFRKKSVSLDKNNFSSASTFLTCWPQKNFVTWLWPIVQNLIPILPLKRKIWSLTLENIFFLLKNFGVSRTKTSPRCVARDLCR